MGSSMAGRVPARSRQFKLEFRSLASLVVWLDQEEELVQLVPEELKELPTSECWARAVEEADPRELTVLSKTVSSDCNLP
jgi:hypothetical protein